MGGRCIATVVVVVVCVSFFFFFFFFGSRGATRRSGYERERENTKRKRLPFPVVDDQFLVFAVVSPTGTEYGISQA